MQGTPGVLAGMTSAAGYPMDVMVLWQKMARK